MRYTDHDSYYKPLIKTYEMYTGCPKCKSIRVIHTRNTMQLSDASFKGFNKTQLLDISAQCYDCDNRWDYADSKSGNIV